MSKCSTGSIIRKVSTPAYPAAVNDSATSGWRIPGMVKCPSFADTVTSGPPSTSTVISTPPSGWFADASSTTPAMVVVFASSGVVDAGYRLNENWM